MSSAPPSRWSLRGSTLKVVIALVSLSASGLMGAPAGAVSASHDQQLVVERPNTWTPHAMNGSVIAMVQVGNKIIAAGSFTSVSPADTFNDTSDDLTRNRIFAFDATTGVIDPDFDPNLGGPVNSLDTDGTSIYVGGRFSSVGSDVARKRLVKLSPTGSVDTAFRAVPNKPVNEVVVRGDRVYVGGLFTSIKRGNVKTTRSHLAVLDAATGEVRPGIDIPFSGIYDPAVGGKTSVKRFDLTPDGEKLVAIGNFTTVGGTTRQSVVVINTNVGTTGVASVDAWNTNRYSLARSNCSNSFDSAMRDLDISPDGKFFVISTTGAFAGGGNAGTLCDSAARWEMGSTGNDPTWIAYTGGDTSYGVAITGGVVYIGGHFRWWNNPFQSDQAGPGAVPRSGVAALDVANGVPLSWNPGRTRGVGAQAMYATADGLWVGSDTTRFSNQRRGRIAFLPLAGGSTLPSVAPATLPNTVFGAGGSSGSSGTLTSRPLDGNGAPTSGPSAVTTPFNWSQVRGAFYMNGEVYYGTSAGTLQRRTFDPATGALGSETAVNLYNDPDNGALTWPNLSNVTGMFYEPTLHRLYYTVSGDSNLYYRYFAPESRIVGAQQFAAAKPSAVSFSSAGGVTLAGSRLLYGSSSDGALRSVPFSGGAVTGTATTLSTDNTWRLRALFVPNG